MSESRIIALEKRIELLEIELQLLKSNSTSVNNISNFNHYKFFTHSIIDIPEHSIIYCLDLQFKYVAFNHIYYCFINEHNNRQIKIGDHFVDSETDNKMPFLTNAMVGKSFKNISEYTVNGIKQYYDEYFKPVYDDDNKIIGICVYACNITLSQKNDKIWEVLLRISEQVHNSESLEDFIRQIHMELAKLIDTTNFYVALYNEEYDNYSFPYYKDQYDVISEFTSVQLKKSLTDYIRSNGIPLLANEQTIKDLVEKGEIKIVGTTSPSWLGVPLKTGGKTIGVMAVQSYTTKGVFTEKDLNIMAFISDHVAMAVERKKTDEELKESSKRLKNAQSIAHVGNWELDIHSQKIRTSDEALRIYGIDKSTPYITVEQFFTATTDEDKKRLMKSLNRLSRQNPMFDEVFHLYRKSDGEVVVVHTKGELLTDKNNEPQKVIGTIQDITKFHDVQIELKRAKEKAEESDKLKSAFLANMSHEIRTPMNAILGFSRLLTNPELSSAQRSEYNEYINNSGQNLLNLINDIIDVSKIEAGQVVVKKTVCQINKILNEIYANYDKQKIPMGKKDIELVLKRPIEDPDFTIISDPFRIGQILSNLVGNALKFIETGYVEFGFIFKSENTFQFYVKDTGIGIPDDKMDLIFSRFGQIQGTKIKNPGGTGLGLSISKHLVELLGGEIWVESNVDQGTTFSFTHPYEPIQASNEMLYPPVKEKFKYDLFGKKILIVEDNQINRTLLSDTLLNYDENIKIDVAVDGKAAIELYKKNDFDIIIMDIRMPIMDGYQATEYIRKKMTYPKNQIPILGLSAHAMKEEKEKSEFLGMNAFLTKPFQSDELLEKIGELTGTRINKPSEITIQPNLEIDTVTSIIDLSLLRKMYQGADDKVNNILSLCLVNIPKQIEDIEKKLSTKDWTSIRIIAHSVKSTFSYIGLSEAQELSKNIELIATEGRDLDTIPHKITKIRNIWEQAVLEIDKILEST